MIPAYTPHMMQSVCEEESQWEYLFFQPGDMWGQLGKELAEDQRFWGEQGWNTYLFSREAYPQMYDLFQSLLRAFRQKPDLYKVTVRGGLLSLLAQVQREKTGVGPWGDGSAAHETIVSSFAIFGSMVWTKSGNFVSGLTLRLKSHAFSQTVPPGDAGLSIGIFEPHTGFHGVPPDTGNSENHGRDCQGMRISHCFGIPSSLSKICGNDAYRMEAGIL